MVECRPMCETREVCMSERAGVVVRASDPTSDPLLCGVPPAPGGENYHSRHGPGGPTPPP